MENSTDLFFEPFPLSSWTKFPRLEIKGPDYFPHKCFCFTLETIPWVRQRNGQMGNRQMHVQRGVGGKRETNILIIWYLISYTLHLILDIWYLMFDTWYLMLDIWHLISDTLYLILFYFLKHILTCKKIVPYCTSRIVSCITAILLWSCFRKIIVCLFIFFSFFIPETLIFFPVPLLFYPMQISFFSAPFIFFPELLYYSLSSSILPEPLKFFF